MAAEENKRKVDSPEAIRPSPDEQQIEERIMPWRFWFLAMLSLLLVVTFGFYLPMRFRYHEMLDVSEGHSADERMGGDNHMMPVMAGDHNGHAAALYHEETDIAEGLSVRLGVSAMPIWVGSSTALDFFVHERPGDSPVPFTALQYDHEKLMHVIGVRSDLEEFFHIHPMAATTTGMFTIPHIFTAPGLYKIWSEIKKDDVVHTWGHPEIAVSGQGERFKKNISFDRRDQVGVYGVGLRYASPLVKGQAIDLDFDITDETGQLIPLESYLGTPMHLVIIKDDWKAFIHAHPEAADHTASAGTALFNTVFAHGGLEEDIHEEDMHSDASMDGGVHFHVTLPESGVYRAFAQFRPRASGLPSDEALVAQFWMKVEDRQALPQGLLLAITSLILIALLSWRVNVYLSKHE